MQQVKKYTGNRAVFIFMWMMLFFTGACSKENVAVPVNPPQDSTSPALSYLALGDSYTIGQSVGIEERFPVQTVNMLRQQGTQINLPVIVATTGWTTGNLLNALAANPPSKNYDLVTLLIGVNNQYQGRSQEEYRTEFSSLLGKAIEYAGGRKSRVFVLSIPDYSVTPFAQNSDTVTISNEIDAFNAINRQISQEAGVRYLNITDISREGRYDAEMNATDGLHPSGKQYREWAALLAPMMKASL